MMAAGGARSGARSLARLLKSTSFSPSYTPAARLFGRGIVRAYATETTSTTTSGRRREQDDTHATTQTSSDPSSGTKSDKQLKFTADSYPEVQRSSRFKKLDQDDIAYFRSILSENGVLVDEDAESFNVDWMRKFRGQSRVVVKPKSSSEVSKVLKYCNEKMLAVVPQSGNTGLVGGSTPVFDEVILSMTGMNKIRSFDEVSGCLVADAGCILENVDNYLADRQHIFPLDLGAKGSCLIGGNAATAAGGLRLLRYGSLHGNILGLEVVLPDGTILDNLSTLRKDNTGFDLKQLFIGSEGTIGVITAMSVLCPQRSSAVNVAFFGVESYEKVLEAFVKAKSHLSEILSAYEFMDGGTQAFVSRHSDLKRPFEGDYPFYVLVETSGSSKEHDDEKLSGFFEDLLESGIVADGAVAQDATQAKALWSLREGITECLGKEGGTYKYDMSAPLTVLYSLVDATREKLIADDLLGEGKPVVDVVGYGHLGDGNIHLNVPVRSYDKRVERSLEPFVYEWVQRHRGSISAEHGLGLSKGKYIGYSKSPDMVDYMKRIKALFDPNGILSPYKYLPPEETA
ncbi:D-lactate ferricytochrome c oxidoreductase [Savitreella phatthalungensis]